MPITEQQTKNFDYADWIKKAIENNFIKYYDHTEFKNKKEIENSNSSVRKIFRSNWNNTNTNLFVKISYEFDVEKIVNELKMQKEVDFHINILRIYEISKLDNQYSLVLEYTDGGSLYFYLKENFTKLEWDDKYCLASQLASAIDFIHSKGIIHCNLHEENVLIHKNNIKVADFGLSKRANKTSNYSNKVLDFLPYLEPRILNNLFNIKCRSQPCITNFKSDIYSIGVLFWLLSSGRKPFYDEGSQYDVNLAMDIVNGKREEIIKGTPVEYSDIYTACWSDDPDERPSIRIVVSCLQSIIDYSIKSITNEIEKKSLNNDFEGMMNDCNISTCNSASNFIIDDDLTSDFVKNNLSLNLTGLTNNVEKIIDKLIEHLIRMHDEWGYTIIETKEIINQNIQNISKSLQIKIFDWLIKNQTSSRYIFFHGFLYFNEIIVKRDKGKAFELFSKASKDNYPIAQVYLGKMYKDPKDSFYWYQKSAENGNKFAQFYLGKCYENGNGTEKDDFKAFECYDIAAKNGNKFAQFKLGYFYYNGIGTQIDKEKSIVWYEKSAMQKCSNAQFYLGILYRNEKNDLKNAFYLAKKAAENGNKVAQFNLGYYYEKGEGIQKDINKAFEWYEKSAMQGHSGAQSSLGKLYKIEKNDLKKAFYWIEKAAKNGCKVAQLHLAYLHENGEGTQKDDEKATEWFETSAVQKCSNAQYVLGVIQSDLYVPILLFWRKYIGISNYRYITVISES
ncbi:kinase-like protein [Rhizophagus irregularis]|nr:kinase-like protein [Rhizophagus irregularis]